MLEMEMKFAVSDFNAVVQQLTIWGARLEKTIAEADHYYNAPDRDFRRTNEALRLRRIGETNFVTYKGPKHPGPVKTRTEHEFALRDGDAAADEFCRLLELLGYRPVAVVRKQRTAYRFDRGGFALETCLDDVEQVGRYVEVEIVAPPEKKGAAQEVILQTTRELGLTNPESRSYLRMLVGDR